MRWHLWESYALFVATYRDMAEKLHAEDPDPPFPIECFPPAMPFMGIGAEDLKSFPCRLLERRWGEVYLGR
jgi:hypothetical protein